MRSKEVDDAIEKLKSNANFCITSIGTTKTILNYISELEQKDKTYEIVEEKIELEDAEKELTMKSLKIIKEYMKDMKENHQYYSHAEEDAIKNLKLYINDSTPNQMIRDLKEKYEKKCAVLGKHSDNLQWYEMGKIFGKAELCEELLERK